LRLLGLDAAANVLRWPNALLGLGAAGYTAFLFGQCEGRDLWQSRWLGPHLIGQALLCGGVALAPFAAGGLLLGVAGAWENARGLAALGAVIAIAAAAHGALSLAERYREHETSNARQGAAFLTTVRLGPLRPFRDGLIIGVVVTMAMAVLAPGLAFLPALVGLYLYEWAFVRAGQLPPLS